LRGFDEDLIEPFFPLNRGSESRRQGGTAVKAAPTRATIKLGVQDKPPTDTRKRKKTAKGQIRKERIRFNAEGTEEQRPQREKVKRDCSLSKTT
jgi:hypothetical protein